jgi:hypothetical protein
MNTSELILEAKRRGFLNASKIRTPQGVIVDIAPDSEVIVHANKEDILLKFNKSENNGFHSTAIIHDFDRNQWAEIKELRHPKLSAFPDSGYCMDPDKRLRDYIKSTRKYSYHQREDKGIAWNHNEWWDIHNCSAKERYYLGQLYPAMPVASLTEIEDIGKDIPSYVKNYPLTPEECFGKKIKDPKELEIGEYYYITWEDTSSSCIIRVDSYFDNDRTKGPYIVNSRHSHLFAKNSSPWVTDRICRKATDEEVLWLEHCISQEKFVSLSEFQETNKSLSHGKSKSSRGSRTSAYEIRTVDFKISRGAPIRAITARCSSGQIKCGSGYKPNKT